MTMDELTAAVRKKHAAVSKEQIAKHLGLHGLHEGARRLIVGQDSENWHGG